MVIIGVLVEKISTLTRVWATVKEQVVLRWA